jgi:hypothetical protein
VKHKFPTIIIDDFFETPSLVREFALQQKFSKDHPGNWPGYRTNMLNELDNELYNKFASKLFSNFVDGRYEYLLDAQFQYSDASYQSGWVHHDNFEKYDFAGVVYLTPDPPENSGTCIYDITEKTKQFSKWEDVDNSKWEFMKEDCSTEIRTLISVLRDEYNSIFKLQDICCNKYNRCLIFSASQQHAEQNFFGSDKYDSRLTLCFFGKILSTTQDHKYIFL